MRKKVLLGAVVALLVFGVAGVALAGPLRDEVRAIRPGILAGLGRAIRERETFTPPAQVLELTDEQVAQIQEILKESAAEYQALMAEIMAKQADLRLLLWQKNPDQAELKAKREELAELRQQLAEVAKQAREEIMAVLTPEQQEKFGDLPGLGARLCRRLPRLRKFISTLF